MDTPKQSGRTTGDALLEILTSWRLLLTLFGFLLVASAFVVNDAEPGTQIDFFGLKYQRARATQKLADTDLTAGYLLPRGEYFNVSRDRATPILDGTIAIEAQIWKANYSDSKPQLLGGAVTGANVDKLKVGSRTVDGRAQTLFRAYKSEDKALFNKEAYIELEFKGAYFSITSEPIGTDGFKVSVAQLKRPTLELQPVSKLLEQSLGGE